MLSIEKEKIQVVVVEWLSRKFEVYGMSNKFGEQICCE